MSSRALVVDDEESIRFALEDILGEMGIGVDVAGSVAEAREILARDRSYDLALIDKNLPDGNGLELVQDLEGSEIGIIVISGYANVSSAVHAIQSGVADYILKPFELADLRARVQRVLDTVALRKQNRRLVEELQQSNSRLERLVATDPLTSLYTFAFLRRHLSEDLARCRRDQQPLALMLIDIDGFRLLNDRHGHQLGDELLIRISKALRGRVDDFVGVRAQDIIARHSADAFAMLLPGTGRDGAMGLAAQLRAAIARHFSGEEFGTVSVSISVTCFPDDGNDVESLLSALELTMEAARPPEGTGLLSFSQDLAAKGQKQRDAATRLATQFRALKRSIAEREFRYVYQPIVDVRAGLPHAYEALVRPLNKAFAHPGELFDTASRSGSIHTLGRVLRRICVEPFERMPHDARLFINLHPLDLFDTELLSGETSLLPFAKNIVLEITEAEEIQNFDRVRESIDVLRRHGFLIAVDDLGAGYSGLNNLALLSPDYVKLDMALVRDIGKQPRLGRLIQHILEYAEGEGMKVIAEGVENIEELEAILKIGVPYVQGYYFARPDAPFVELDAEICADAKRRWASRQG